MWNFLTITNSVSDGQIYDYKQLPSNTKIGDPTKTDRYCEVCQGYLPFSSLVWWYVILIVIIEILKILKLYIPLSESPHFPDVRMTYPAPRPLPSFTHISASTLLTAHLHIMKALVTYEMQ